MAGLGSTLADICSENRNIYSGASQLIHNISEFFATKGFKALRYVGKGEQALVVAPVDNPDIVFRIAHLDQTRKPVAYILSQIGTWEVEGALSPLFRHTKIEVLPRLSMDVTPAELKAFESEVHAHGYHRTDSSAQPGRLRYTKADGTSGEALVTSDTGALDFRAPVQREGKWSLHEPDYSVATHAPHHPSLVDQIEHNIRLAAKDSRLTEFMPELRVHANRCRKGKVLQPYTPSQRAANDRRLLQEPADLLGGMVERGVLPEGTIEKEVEGIRRSIQQRDAFERRELSEAAQELRNEGLLSADALPSINLWREIAARNGARTIS